MAQVPFRVSIPKNIRVPDLTDLATNIEAARRGVQPGGSVRPTATEARLEVAEPDLKEIAKRVGQIQGIRPSGIEPVDVDLEEIRQRVQTLPQVIVNQSGQPTIASRIEPQERPVQATPERRPEGVINRAVELSQRGQPVARPIQPDIPTRNVIQPIRNQIEPVVVPTIADLNIQPDGSVRIGSSSGLEPAQSVTVDTPTETVETVDTTQNALGRGGGIAPENLVATAPVGSAPINNTVFGEINETTRAINQAQGDLSGVRNLTTSPQAQADFVLQNPFFNALADEAQRRLLNNQAARGKVGSGGTAEALQNSILLLGQDLLNQNIGQRQNVVTQGLNIAGQRGGVANQRFNLAALGANAAAGQATATQNTAAQNAALQQAGAGNITDLVTQGANALAAGRVGAANARNQGINSAFNNLAGLGTILTLGGP